MPRPTRNAPSALLLSGTIHLVALALLAGVGFAPSRLVVARAESEPGYVLPPTGDPIDPTEFASIPEVEPVVEQLPWVEPELVEVLPEPEPAPRLDEGVPLDPLARARIAWRPTRAVVFEPAREPEPVTEVEPEPAPVATTEVPPPPHVPILVDGPPPRYPLASVRRDEQGMVLLSILVARDGSVDSVHVLTSSGFARLDTAATEAVQDWRFQPLPPGVPAPAEFRHEVAFVLHPR